MGCSSSSPAPNITPKPAAETPHVRLAKRRKNSIHMLEAQEKQALNSMFLEYRKTIRESKSAGDSMIEMSTSVRGSFRGQGTHKLMKKDGLRKILPNVDDKIFELIWPLFDRSGDGFVDADEFMMAMALLSTGIADSVEAQLEAVFCMFDSSNSEMMSMEDFESMIGATINLQLDSLLDSSKGAEAFEAQLKKEYSDENLAFWKAVREYRVVEDGAERLAKAKELCDEFVSDTAMRQVNLPSHMQKQLLSAVGACTETAPADAFEAASQEIFKLMEKDTFNRFKSDPEALAHLVEGYYKEAGVEHGSPIPYAKFREWALKEPAVLVFFSGLCDAVSKFMSEYKIAAPTSEELQSV